MSLGLSVVVMGATASKKYKKPILHIRDQFPYVFPGPNPYKDPIQDPLLVPGKTVFGWGVDIEDPKTPLVIAIPDADLKGHIWGLGTTRVGKTRMIQNLLRQFIKKGWSVLLIDPKGDNEIWSATYEYAEQTGRLDELLYVNPVFPEHSAPLDPLAFYAMPEELIGHIIAGIPTTGEQFFRDVAKQVASAIVRAKMVIAQARGDKAKFNMLDVKRCIPQRKLKELREEVMAVTTSDPDLLSDKERVIAEMDAILSRKEDYYDKITSSLVVTLDNISTGNIGRFVGMAKGNRFIERLEEGNRAICVVQCASMIDDDAGATLGKVTLSTVKAFVGRKYAESPADVQPINPPLVVIVDEAQSVLFKGIDELFAKAGGAGVYMIGFSQSRSQLDEKLGLAGAKVVLDNCNTQASMKVNSIDTADYVSKHFGVEKRFDPILSIGGEIAASVRMTEEANMRGDMILRMKPRQFLLRTYIGLFKGLTFSTLPPGLLIDPPKIRRK